METTTTTTTENSQNLDQIMNHAVALYAEDKNSYEVKEDLMRNGMSEEIAVRIADEANELYNDLLKKKADNNILYGALWLIGGLLVTVISYSSSGGSRYFLTYGAILGGLIQLISGIYQRSKIG